MNRPRVLVCSWRPSQGTLKKLGLPPDHTYSTFFNVLEDKFVCDCPGFLLGHKDCKHVKKLKEARGLNDKLSNYV